MEEQVPSSNQPTPTSEEGAYYENQGGPRYSNPAEFSAATGIPLTTQAPPPPPQMRPQMSFQQMREKALQDAIAQVATGPAASQQPFQPQQQIQPPVPQPEPKVVYVRRNLTLAELGVMFLISAGIVLGGQGLWNFTTDLLPRIEIRDK